MTDIHSGMTDFLRKYYSQYKSVPPIRIMRQRVGRKIWEDKHLKELYPAGPNRKLCKIAGLPKTAGEIENACVLGVGVLV